MAQINKRNCEKIQGIWKKEGCYLPHNKYPKKCPICGEKQEFEHIMVDHDEQNSYRPTMYIHCVVDKGGTDLIVIDEETDKVLYIDDLMV